MSEAILVAFGAAESVVRHARAKIMREQMGADGWVDALKEVDAILDLVPMTVYERFVVREATTSLVNEWRASLSRPKPTT